MWRVSWILVAACSSSSPELIVDLRTDYAPGREFQRVAVRVDGVIVAERSVSEGDDFGSAQPHVAELRTVNAGLHEIEVELQRRDTVVAARRVRARVEGELTIVLVVITRACGGVSCPPSGAPTATECVGGECVAPSCVTGGEPGCPTRECLSDQECARELRCRRTACAGGACLDLGDTCAAGERCDDAVGCVPAMPPDAGLPDGSAHDGPIADASVEDVQDPPHEGGLDVPEAGADSAPPPDDARADACPATEADCGDGRDDDCDGEIDCADPDCAEVFDCCVRSTAIETFDDDGAYMVPGGVRGTIIKLWGAGGGAGAAGASGGGGGFAMAPIAVTPGELLTITVGRPGPGGEPSRVGGGGGGASSVRRSGVRLAVAGGGGGGGAASGLYVGGGGGGLSGEAGASWPAECGPGRGANGRDPGGGGFDTRGIGPGQAGSAGNGGNGGGTFGAPLGGRGDGTGGGGQGNDQGGGGGGGGGGYFGGGGGGDGGPYGCGGGGGSGFAPGGRTETAAGPVAAAANDVHYAPGTATGGAPRVEATRGHVVVLACVP